MPRMSFFGGEIAIDSDYGPEDVFTDKDGWIYVGGRPPPENPPPSAPARFKPGDLVRALVWEDGFSQRERLIDARVTHVGHLPVSDPTPEEIWIYDITEIDRLNPDRVSSWPMIPECFLAPPGCRPQGWPKGSR